MKLVIFDVDGTLIDSQAMILGAMAAAYGEEGLDCPDRAAVLSIVGLSLPVAMARLSPELPAARIEKLVAAYKLDFAAQRVQETAPLYPGAFEAVQALGARDDVLLGIATGKSRRGLDLVLEAHGLSGWFVTRQVADDHPSKPHPSMLLAALAETGATQAVMLGDTSYDMDMARNAGLPGLGVAWGYHPPELLTGAGAVAVLRDFAELPATLDGVWRAA